MSEPEQKPPQDKPEPEKAGNEEFLALGIGCLVTIIFLGSVVYFGMMRG